MTACPGCMSKLQRERCPNSNQKFAILLYCRYFITSPPYLHQMYILANLHIVQIHNFTYLHIFFRIHLKKNCYQSSFTPGRPGIVSSVLITSHNSIKQNPCHELLLLSNSGDLYLFLLPQQQTVTC